MRITRELLHKIAEDTVKERAAKDKSIVAAYLHGSVWDGPDPVFGGTADIDLVFIHDKFDLQREIIRLTEDVTLDIEHHAKETYQPPKDLRQRPRLGYTVFGCKPLYDPDHFFDFTQASVRGLFHNYENVMARCQELLNRGRATWLFFHNRPYEFGPEQVATYLQAVEDAVNAVVCLSSAPLAERRFLIDFVNHCEKIGKFHLYADLIKLLGGLNLADEQQSFGVQAKEELKGWMLDWEENFTKLNEMYEIIPELHTHRRAYYMRAYEEMISSDQPEAVLWPMLITWTQMAQTMPSQAEKWEAFCERLGLVGSAFEARLDDLDAYLDKVEILLEEWEVEGA